MAYIQDSLEGMCKYVSGKAGRIAAAVAISASPFLFSSAYAQNAPMRVDNLIQSGSPAKSDDENLPDVQAGYATIPPITPSQLETILHPLPAENNYVSKLTNIVTFNRFQGKNEELMQEAKNSDCPTCAKEVEEDPNNGPGLGDNTIGRNYDITLSPQELWKDKFMSNGKTVYVSAIRSVDAYDLNLKMDLSGLNSGDSFYVIDPTLPSSMGPFKYENNETTYSGQWMPTVEGDTAVLVAVTSSNQTPNITAKEISHMFIPIGDIPYETMPKEDLEKRLPCMLDVMCSNNQAAKGITATSAGFLKITTNQGSWYCSGNLINNPNTPEKEPYLVTAHHCIKNNSEAVGTEVFWDFKRLACGGQIPDKNNLGNFPRSQGKKLLATNSSLDGTLIELKSVPGGINGRNFMGYNTSQRAVNENIYGVHFPDSTRMSYSAGKITEVNMPDYRVSNFIWSHQNFIDWNISMAEPGSSGSALLNNQNEIIGMLSAGHKIPYTCNDDWACYSSFRHFYSDNNLKKWLYDKPIEPPPCTGSECGIKMGGQGISLAGLAMLSPLMFRRRKK
ncbi:MAG: trypsin-like peptidase domain-containing protein [Candidatus Pacearchaeota archaeon]|jgi:V8-like Glu-specific endopeptidase